MNVDLLIKENKELSEEKQRYKEMWFSANDSLSKYRELEEHIGCPLEVRLQINCDTVIYDDNGNEYEVDYVYENNFVCHNGQCDDFGCDYEFTFNWKDYKKTWWLKEDKSE